ncbi:MAG: peptidylprolyl isomerase [Clostridia bacterium]|nr:peptidylprolyl isomerase [Clostridia bacterium]
MGKGQRSKKAAGAATFTAKKDEKKGKLKGVLIGIAIAAVLLILVGLTVFNMSQDQGWFKGNEVVMSTDNYSVNQGMFAYFFRESYMNVNNTYYSILGDNVSQYIDTSKSLKEQPYGGEEYDTWYDYILAQTKATINEYLIFSEEARAAGVSLDNDDRAEINSHIGELKDAAKTAGYSSSGDYIRAAFGVGVNEAKIRKALELEHLATKYAQKIADAVDVSDEVLEAKYNEDPDKYDRVSYLLYTFRSDDLLPKTDAEDENAAEPTDEEVAAAIEKIKTSAGELAAVKSEDEFRDYVRKYATDVLGKDESAADAAADGVLKENVSNSDTEAMKWAFSAKAGETNVIECSEGKTQEVYFLVTEKRRVEDDGAVSVRHVLFKHPTKDTVDENAEDKEAAQAAADEKYDSEYEEIKAKAQEVYDKWVEEGHTEDAVIELAKEHSEDTSAENGGLIENVTKGQFVEPFNTWLFEEGRKAGDYTLLETEYGWHIVYYVSKGEPQWKTTITSNLKTEAYESAKSAATEKYPVTVNDDKIEVSA